MYSRFSFLIMIYLRQQVRKAFSTIELIMVMLVMSLLVFVFVFGKKMVHNSDLIGLMHQYQKYASYIEGFHDRFDYYPGDFNNAYEYWPDYCDSEEECNGDGDDEIEAYEESHLVWLHLRASGVIGGTFTGIGDGDDYTQTGGINVPEGELYPTQFSVVYYEGSEFPDDNHYIIIGGMKSEDLSYGAAIKPDDAYYLDEKLDDAYPSHGIVWGRNGYRGEDYDSSSCLIDTELGEHVSNSTTDSLNVTYNSNVDNRECFLAIRF